MRSAEIKPDNAAPFSGPKAEQYDTYHNDLLPGICREQVVVLYVAEKSFHAKAWDTMGIAEP